MCDEAQSEAMGTDARFTFDYRGEH